MKRRINRMIQALVFVRLGQQLGTDIEYGKLWGTRYSKMAEQSGVYADRLRSHFTATTGLDCTL